MIKEVSAMVKERAPTLAPFGTQWEDDRDKEGEGL